MYNNAFLFSGYPASGKSTALEVADEFDNIFTDEMSNFVRHQYKNETGKDKINDNDLGTWAAGLKSENGMGYFAEQMVSELRSNAVPLNENVAISGIRSPEEVMAFVVSPAFQSVTVIGVVANQSTRFERVNEREDMDRETFDERNSRELDWGVDKVLQYSDIYLQNEHVTQERFRKKVETVIEGLLQNPVQSWSEDYVPA